MRYRNVHLIYFSPTHTSAKIVYAIAEGMGAISMSESDVTREAPDSEEHIDDELTIIAAPVYGGRVAETAAERLRMFRSTYHAPAVPVVLYGNRDYEDALRELCDLVSEQGFVPVAAAAFIGEHSFSREGMPVAEGRPDESDLEQAAAFGRKIIERLEQVSCVESLSALEVRGHFPYREKSPSTPQAPVTDNDACTRCGYCVEVCPTHAISSRDGDLYSDPELCIKCCACVKECPEGARTFDTPYTAMLHKNFSARREPEVFFSRFNPSRVRSSEAETKQR
ncbi:4Fe-4S binding protein [Parabacteroides sp. ZJ-118]|uniref:4Fe-4S binding protein n=1 Tax=Parabacteroides sp. ZJ-118 TaxID=2709398 RepID=UPI0013EB0012|nr:4Fe-4S binding protein [Parabacteroides sp. ZJ-118]